MQWAAHYPHLAASLNRLGMPTGQGKTWTAPLSRRCAVWASSRWSSSRAQTRCTI